MELQNCHSVSSFSKVTCGALVFFGGNSVLHAYDSSIVLEILG